MTTDVPYIPPGVRVYCSTWQETARHLLRTIDPHPPRRPLYFLTDRDLPAEHGLHGCGEWVGLAPSCGDLFCQAVLERRGQWIGRGDLILVHETRLRAQGSWWGEDGLMGLILHEYAHHVSHAGKPLATEPLAALPAAIQTALLNLVNGRLPPPGPAPAWQAHGPPWLRAVVHMQHRAAIAGWHFPLEEIVAGSSVGLAGVAVYAEALADEPQRRAGEALREIIASPAPPLFEAFAPYDLERAAKAWKQERKQKGESP